MLKRWKQNRKGTDSSSTGADNDQGPSSRLNMLGVQQSDQPTAEHHVLGSLESSTRVYVAQKHARPIIELESARDDELERPTKRRKTDNLGEYATIEQSHVGPLPEFAEVQELRSGLDDKYADEVEDIVAVARKKSIIAVVDDPLLKTKCSCSMLSWSYDKERALPYIGIARRKKIAIVVCNDEEAPSECAAELAEHCSLSIGVYNSSSKPTLSYWSELSTRDVIVIGAASLLESLACGSLAIPQIHILIISDAGPVDKDVFHPIRQIMGEYYVITDTLSRPKVLSFCDSLATTRSDQQSLERILDATIHIHRKDLLQEDTTSQQPLEFVVFYEPNVNRAETTLLKLLHSFDPSETVFRSQFCNAKLALADLGPCASDLIWRRAFKEIDSVVPATYDDEDDDDVHNSPDGLLARTKANIRNSIKNWVFAMPNLDPSSRGFNVSSKLLKLIQILKACEPEGDAFRGLVFVQKRSIAFVLVDIIRMLEDQLGFIRPMALSRHGPSLESSAEADVLEGFKSGLYNLLIVTKHGEDLDIVPALMVVRYDLFESQVSYAYCRARARERQSHLVHMAERGNDIHRRILLQAAKLDRKLQKWIDKVSRSRHSAVPPYPLRETVNPYRSDSEDEGDEEGPFVQDPTTSGRIYIQDALTVVYRYASNMPQPLDAPLSPLFEIDAVEVAGGTKLNYICTVLLPPETPIRRVSGSPCHSPSQARRSGCYQACVELFNRGLLDYRLFPRQIFSPRDEGNNPPISADTNVKNAMADGSPIDLRQAQQKKPSGVGSYHRKHPDFWPNTLGTMRGCLYPTIFAPTASVSDGEGGAHAPILILTRMPLPPIAPFKVFFSGIARRIDVINAASIDVDDDRLQLLHRYTLRIVRALMNKAFTCSLENMCYFFAPLPASWSDPNAGVGDLSLPDVTEHIRWDLVQAAADKALTSLNSQDNQTLATDLEDAIVQDRWVEFTRRFYAAKLRTDLTPLSKPEDSPRERGYENLLEYCKARRKGFLGLQNNDQPLIQVERVPSVVNNLNPSSRPPADSKRYPAKYLIPELCARSTISASIYRTALLLPSILRRVDDMLLVKELNAKFFDHSIAESHLHAAISSPSATVEVDYERLELLGDAYLKYLASIYVFVTNPTQSEGALHTIRQRIVSNKALLENASRCGLPQYIQSKPFTPKIWSPPNFHMPEPTGVPKRSFHSNASGQLGKPEDSSAALGNANTASTGVQDPVDGTEATMNETVDKSTEKSSATIDQVGLAVASEKTTEEADLSKACADKDDGVKASNTPNAGKQNQKKRGQVGADMQSLGDKCVADVAEAIIGAAYITGGREVALKVTKALHIPVPHIDRWSDFGRKALAPPPEVTAKLRDGSVEAVEGIIGHKIKRPHLLAQALTHASIHGNEMTCYERLEFIGDAILDFLVIRHIFYRDGLLSPGALTLLKGAMVSNVTLAAVCVSAGLHKHLHYESAALAAGIRAYATELVNREKNEIKQAAQEHRSPGQYWTEVEPPKALSDVIESIIGAVFLSDNFSPIGAEAFFDKILKPFYDKYITLQTLSHHPTKILLELLQSRGCQNFELLREHVPNTSKTMVNCDVIVHDVILSRATDVSAPLAARRACFYALDALEGDPTFVNRTCDCRMTGQSRKKAKTSLLNLDEDEEMIVEGVLG